MFSNELEQYSNLELLNLIEHCNKLHDVYDLLDEKKAQRLFELIEAAPPKRLIKNKTIQALLLPLTDESSYPLMLLWSIIGLVSVGTLPLLISTAIMLVTSLSISGFFFYANYKEMVRRENKINKTYYLSELLNQAADRYLANQDLQIEATQRPQYTAKNKLSLIKEAIRPSLTITTSLFGTYFMGLNAIFSALGFTVLSATAGPVGIVIGLGVAVATGIYFGFTHYKKLSKEDLYHFKQTTQSVIVKQKTLYCRRIEDNLLTNENTSYLSLFSPEGTKLKNKFVFEVMEAPKQHLNRFFGTQPREDASHTIDHPLIEGNEQSNASTFSQ